MTQGTTSKDTFESTRELERTIAEGLWTARPRELTWDKFTVDYMETGSMSRFVALVYQDRQIVGRQSISHDMFWAAKRLRQGMYSEGKGTWLSMTLTITSAGSGWEASYNYNQKPAWESPEPAEADYSDELTYFPRNEDHVPGWFREELKGVKTPSQKQQDIQQEQSHNRILEQTAQALDAAWSMAGTVNPLLYTNVINLGFHGGPQWPGVRQAFQKIDNVGAVSIVASDGLSDPCLEQGYPLGEGLEVYLASTALVGKGIHELDRLWQFELLYLAAQVVAHRPGLYRTLKRPGGGGLTLQNVKHTRAPRRWRNAAGLVDLILGVKHPHVPRMVGTPNGDVALVGIVLLHPKESAYIERGGPDACSVIAQRLEALRPEELNSPRRKPVVSG